MKTIEGEIFYPTYSEFLAADACWKHRRTAKTQREELEQHITDLAEQHDYYSLDLLRILSGILAEDLSERNGCLFNMIRTLLCLDEKELKTVRAFVNGYCPGKPVRRSL